MLSVSLVVYKWYDLEGKKKEEMLKKLKDMGLY